METSPRPWRSFSNAEAAFDLQQVCLGAGGLCRVDDSAVHRGRSWQRPASTLMHVGFVFGTWALKVLEDEQEQEQDVVGELLICCGDLTSAVGIVLQRPRGRSGRRDVLRASEPAV